MTRVDTIYALSSGALPAGVALVRISGPQSRLVLETLLGRVPPPRKLVHGAIRTLDGALLDKGMAAFFPAPASASGEDMAELHLHGSRAVVAAVSSALSGLRGLRGAEPGEFTRRAFLNGKLDLVQAEALADLIDAETEAQRRFALQNAEGLQSQLYGRWHDRLLHARALIEAELDFADEADVPDSVSDQVWEGMADLAGEIETHLHGYHRAEIIRDGFTVVIVGLPNAGKSSLINALSRRDVAIVSDEPGTTRDLIEVALDLGGMKVRLIDTAGIRQDASSNVERIGIERATQRAKSADLILALEEPYSTQSLTLPKGVPVLKVRTKADLACQAGQDKGVSVSVVTGQGLAQLLELLRHRAEQAASVTDLMPSRERHVRYLEACARDVRLGVSMADSPLEERAELLRSAAVQLGRITGEVNAEDLLGAIFASFCIGK